MSDKKQFKDYFKESMDSLGLPAPDSLFNSLGSASSSFAAIIAVVEKYGTSVTVMEIVKTAPKGVFSVAFAGEALLVVGGVTAAFYAGACLGALLYAIDRSYGLSDKLFSATDYKVGHLYTKATNLGVRLPRCMFAVLARHPQLRGAAVA